MFFDPMYLVFILPGMLFALWAQAKVRTAYAEAEQIPSQAGLTGAQVAQRILDMNRIDDVAIEREKSFLGDHYDPQKRILRLSPGVYDSASLAAVGIAAHEVGHAIQHAHAYAPLSLRSNLVPVCMIGTNLSWILIMAGIMIQPFRILALLGIGLFSLSVLFTLVTLPVEFDASRRARVILTSSGLTTGEEDRVVRKVLNAAAWTYVAAALTSILQLLYYVSLVSGRRND